MTDPACENSGLCEGPNDPALSHSCVHCGKELVLFEAGWYTWDAVDEDGRPMEHAKVQSYCAKAVAEETMTLIADEDTESAVRDALASVLDTIGGDGVHAMLNKAPIADVKMEIFRMVQLHEERAVIAANKAAKVWEDAVRDAVLISHAPVSFDASPQEMIKAMQRWESTLALDPRVSKDAADMLERATKAEGYLREALAKIEMLNDELSYFRKRDD